MKNLRLNKIAALLLLSLLLPLFLLAGCESAHQINDQVGIDDSTQIDPEVDGLETDIPPPATPDLPIVKYLSEHSYDYIYTGHNTFEREAMGYTLNFMHEFEPERKAEFYVFPLPVELEDENRNDVVFGFTRHSLEEMLQAQELGLIENLEIINKTAWRFNNTILTEVTLKLVINNNPKLSILYLSESGKFILRARITMADLEMNQEHNSRDFVRTTFLEIINGLEHEAVEYANP